MTALVLRRLAWTALVVWFVVTATFAMTTCIPADPARARLGQNADEAAVARVRAHYCLDRPFVVQYGCYVGAIARGDLGESLRTDQPVAEIITSHAWPTLQLALAAIVLQLFVGIPLGVVAAVRRGRWPDHASNVMGLLGQSAPSFFVGWLFLYLAAYCLGWFPIGGYGHGFLDRLHHLVLPTATVATLGVAYYARIVRSELVDALGEDYVRTARAKGVPERAVIARHALRNALGPLVTIVGLDFGFVITSEAVTEYIFSWPGIGRELLLAILGIDVPVILGIVLVVAIAIALANLLVDLAQLELDPRLRDG